MRTDHFRGVLGSYADWLVNIVEDELSDLHSLHLSITSGHTNAVGSGVSGICPANFGEVVGLPNKIEGHSIHGMQQQQQHQPLLTAPSSLQLQQHQNTIHPELQPTWITCNGLLGWIETEYGFENTQHLLAASLLARSEKEQLEVRVFQCFTSFP